MTVQIQSALLENPAGRFCLNFQKDPSAREGGTVVAATPQRVGKSNAALPPDGCAFGRFVCHRLAAARRFTCLSYSCSVRTPTLVVGTTARFARGVSEIGSTIHIQPKWPFLSYVQAAPPRFQISIRQ